MGVDQWGVQLDVTHRSSHIDDWTHTSSLEDPMFIVHVFVSVKPDHVEAFRQASVINAKNSVKEPGVARFDVIQQRDDATQFVLVEVYRTPDDPAKHKETQHYLTWRETVAPMMAEPRRALKYEAVFPGEEGWDVPNNV